MYSFSNVDIDPPPTEGRMLCDATQAWHKQAGNKGVLIFMKGTDLYAYFESEDCSRSLDLATVGEKSAGNGRIT